MLWVGTYPAKGGEGLYPLTDEETLDRGQPAAAIGNASFGLWCGRTRTAYFVDEQEAGRVTAWRRSEGRWHELASCGSGGSLPCYLSLHPAGDYLAVANYGDGSVALIRREDEPGALVMSDLVRHSGRGKDPERQSSPHAHCALFGEDGTSLYVADLGLDRVFRYRPQGGRLGTAEVAFEAPAGSGPRHLLLHPNGRHALLLCELSAELILLARSRSGFTALQRIPTAPESAGSGNLGGHLALAPDGHVLVTNRGHDSLAAFALDGDRLTPSAWRHTGGASPRHFLVRGDRAIVAHENSGDIGSVLLPHAGGEEPARIAPLPGAAFVLEVPDRNGDGERNGQ